MNLTDLLPSWLKPKEPPVQPSQTTGDIVKWDKPTTNLDILEKWRRNELPSDLLQAAQVPSYDEWKFYKPSQEQIQRQYQPYAPTYKPRQVEMHPATGKEIPAEYTPYQPDVTGKLPEDVYGGMALSPEYAHPYATGVAKPITAGILEKIPAPSPTPEVSDKHWWETGGLYGLPSAEKQEKIRQMVASEVPSLPLWVTPIGGEAKGAKISKEILEQATKFAEGQLEKRGVGALEDIVKGISKSMPGAQARKIVEEAAERAGLIRWVGGKKVAAKILEVAPKVGEVAGKIPPNLPPEVVAKLQPILTDPLTPIRIKVLNLNQRVKSIITKQEALYRAERGGRFGKAETALTQAGTAEEGQRAALHELKGELPKVTYTPEDIGLTAADKALIKEHIRFIPDLKLTKKVNALDAIDRLFGKFDTEGNRIIPQRNQVKLIDEILGAKLPTDRKNLNLLLDIMNIPRATLASFDVSGGLRQNVFFLFGHPIASTKAMLQGGIKPFFGEMWNDFAGAVNWSLNKAGGTKQLRLNNWTKEVEASIEANPWYDTMADGGWPITERSRAGGKILKMEETFASSFAAKIPFVKWAEAGYVNLLNKVRVDVGSSCLDKWVRAGVNVDDDFIRMWGKVVGQLTGRGDWEAIRQALPVFNSFLFSPRLQLARVQLPFTYIQCWKNPAYRPVAKEMTRNIVAFVAGNATLLGLAKMAMDVYGKDKISVDFNPISTDFGRIKMGNTRVDFSGGFIPYIRLIAQLVTNRKITGAGKVVSLDEWPYGGRWGQFTSFTEMKFAPILSLVKDIMQGQDAVGNKIEWTPKGIGKEAYKRLTPMVIQDTIDAVNEHGLVEGMAYGTLSFFGATVMTYEPTTGKTQVGGEKIPPTKYIAPSKPFPAKK